jgi:hypothetical protein
MVTVPALWRHQHRSDQFHPGQLLVKLNSRCNLRVFIHGKRIRLLSGVIIGFTVIERYK